MANYTMICESGAVVLVRGANAQAVEEAWDKEAAHGNAEPRVVGTTAKASRGDIEGCVDSGHDYR